MSTLARKTEDPIDPQAQNTVLELTVNNHPGVMSHICGLFSRRAFNVEGILCAPIGHGQQSRVWLLVVEDRRLDQMIKQVKKLQDVLDVRHQGPGPEAFLEFEKLFRV
jgi:acetolactate synthase-1/3 small subunit